MRKLFFISTAVTVLLGVIILFAEPIGIRCNDFHTKTVNYKDSKKAQESTLDYANYQRFKNYDSAEEFTKHYGKEAYDRIKNFDEEKFFEEFDKLENIRIYEDDENTVEVYRNKTYKDIIILDKGDIKYAESQIYLGNDSCAEGFEDIVRQTEKETGLCLTNSCYNGYGTNLVFSNTEMQIITGATESAIIYDLKYGDTSFESDRLPISVVYKYEEDTLKCIDIYYAAEKNKRREDYIIEFSLGDNISEAFKAAFLSGKNAAPKDGALSYTYNDMIYENDNLEIGIFEARFN